MYSGIDLIMEKNTERALSSFFHAYKPSPYLGKTKDNYKRAPITGIGVG